MRAKIVIIILFLIMSISYFISTQIEKSLSQQDDLYAQTLAKIRAVQEDNIQLEDKILTLSSFQHIAAWAASQGFTHHTPTPL